MPPSLLVIIAAEHDATQTSVNAARTTRTSSAYAIPCQGHATSPAGRRGLCLATAGHLRLCVTVGIAERRCIDQPVRTSPARTKRPGDLRRQLDLSEEPLGIEVVLSRLVDDANEAGSVGFCIRQRHVDLPPLERNAVPRVRQAYDVAGGSAITR